MLFSSPLMWQNWEKLQVKLEFSIQKWGKLKLKLEFCPFGTDGPGSQTTMGIMYITISYGVVQSLEQQPEYGNKKKYSWTKTIHVNIILTDGCLSCSCQRCRSSLAIEWYPGNTKSQCTQRLLLHLCEANTLYLGSCAVSGVTVL